MRLLPPVLLGILATLGCCGSLTGNRPPSAGLELIYAPADPALASDTAEVMRARLDRAKVRSYEVEVLDGGRIAVRLGGKVDTGYAKLMLSKEGRLEFLVPAAVLEPNELPEVRASSAELKAAIHAAGIAAAGSRLFVNPPEFPYQSLSHVFVVTEPAALDHSHVATAEVEQDQFGVPYVALQFDEDGRRIFGEVTERQVGAQLLIVFDGELNSAPVVQEPIRGGRASITLGSGAAFGDLEREAAILADVLGTRALPTPLTLEVETTFGE